MVGVVLLGDGGLALWVQEEVEAMRAVVRRGMGLLCWGVLVAGLGGAAEQRLVFNNESEPESLDPHRATGVSDIRLLDQMYEGLTEIDRVKQAARPAVAESWSVSADGLVYDFKIRAGARWSDGRAVTAEDFRLSWRRALDAKTGCSYANLFFVIEGAKAFHGGTGDFERVGVTCPEPGLLRVRLAHACGYFLELTSFPTYYPVRVELEAMHGEAWTRPGKVIVNGAFVPEEWLPRQRLTLVRNGQYWGKADVRLERIVALPLDDLNTAYQMFMRKEVDWMPSVPQSRIEEVRRQAEFMVSPYFGTYFYRFNVTRPPFDDARVRRAFSLATDRREITEHLLKGGQIPVGSLCPPVSGYEPVAGLGYDRDAARRLLAEAGYGAGGKEFPAVELLYNTSEAHKLLAEALAQQWKRNLGVTVSARNTEWKIFLNEMKDLNFQICRASWIGDYADPSTFFDIFMTGDGNNRTGWSHAGYDELANRARVERDAGKRMGMYREMEKLLVEEECPILPLYRYVSQSLLSERVGGWRENIMARHDLKRLWMED